MEFRLLGPMEVSDGGRRIPLGGRRQRMVLAVLLVDAGRVVGTDRLIDEVWGEDTPEAARKALQAYVSRLRKLIGGDRLEPRAHGYVLNADPDELDAAAFEALIAEGREALITDPATAAAKFANALTLWRGRPFGDLADEPSLVPEVVRLEELRLVAAEGEAEAKLALGESSKVLGDLSRLIAANPLRERLRALQMQALVAQGRNAEALQAYQDLRKMLAESLGIEPSESLQRLEEEILTRTPVAVGAAAAGARNPYKGLRAFGEGDAGDFFGRDDLVRTVASRLDAESFVTLVGPSGCGKSSAVAAGLVPALRRGIVDRSDWWTIVRMMPGPHPFASLDVALSRAAGGGEFLSVLESGETGLLRGVSRLVGEDGVVLLIIDQFEELFALVEDEGRRKMFLDALLVALDDPHSPLKVIATLRADFYGRPLEYPEFGPRFTDSVVNVLPLTIEELRAAVTQPATAVGVPVESELVGGIVGDVANQPGALPLFQYCLTEMFDRREGGALSLASYERIGGLRGALVGRAERIYASLDHEDQEAFRQVALRLVTVGAEGEATRRRVVVSELRAMHLDPERLDGVLQRFGEYRLLTFDRDAVTSEPTVEVAHEALLREWGRYREWIDGARLDLRRRAAVSAAARDWIEAGRDPAYLFAGSRLEEYGQWQSATSLTLTDLESEFVAASIARRNEEAAEEAARQRRERELARSARLRLRVAVGVVLVAVIVGVIALFGFEQVPRVALYYEGNTGGFNTLALNGVRRAAAQFDLDLFEYAPVATEEGFTLRSAAEEVGSGGVVIINGFILAGEAEFVAPDYPNVTFVVIDEVEILDNVVSVWFAMEEGSFLAGAAAAQLPATDHVGFVGGADTVVIDAFEEGFRAGVHAVDPTIEVEAQYLGDFFDLDGARTVAESMYRNGADVVYHAAGGAGYGVFEAASAYRRETGAEVWAIGVDNDEYYTVEPALRPVILTSAVKQIDVAVYRILEQWINGELHTGVRVMQLGEGVDIATSGEAIGSLLPLIEPYREQIMSGQIVVPNAGTRPEVPADLGSPVEAPGRFPLRAAAIAAGIVAGISMAAFLWLKWWPEASSRARRFALAGAGLTAIAAVGAAVLPGFFTSEFDPLSVIEAWVTDFNDGGVEDPLMYFEDGASVWLFGKVGNPEFDEEMRRQVSAGTQQAWTNCEVMEWSVFCDVEMSDAISRVAGVSMELTGTASISDDHLIEIVRYTMTEDRTFFDFYGAWMNWLLEEWPNVYTSAFDLNDDQRVWDDETRARLIELAEEFVDESPIYPLSQTGE